VGLELNNETRRVKSGQGLINKGRVKKSVVKKVGKYK
jgi:hypothetical protein